MKNFLRNTVVPANPSFVGGRGFVQLVLGGDFIKLTNAR